MKLLTRNNENTKIIRYYLVTMFVFNFVASGVSGGEVEDPKSKYFSHSRVKKISMDDESERDEVIKSRNIDPNIMKSDTTNYSMRKGTENSESMIDLSNVMTITEKSSIFYNNIQLRDLANELQDILWKSGGIRLPIVDVMMSANSSISLIIDSGVKEIERDGFIISFSQKEVLIKGKSADAVAFGLYDLLEKNIGVRWLFPHQDDIGTYIPKKSVLKFSRKDRVDSPTFLNREISSGSTSRSSSYKKWIKHHRLGSSKTKFIHNLFKLFPPSSYRQTNPEYYPVHQGIKYPLIESIGKGTSEKWSWQPVVTAKGVTKEAINNVILYFKNNPKENWYSLGMNDSEVWGDEQINGKPLNSLGLLDMSDYYFSWVNDVVSEVAKAYPSKKYGLLAYSSLADAPTFSLNESVIPYITYDGMQWVNKIRQNSFKKRISDWNDKASELGFYDYIYGDMTDTPYSYIVPRMYIFAMAEYLRFCVDNGVKHYYAEAYPSLKWTEGPKLYVLAKLLWNPNIDVKSTLIDWYISAVGVESAEYLKLYYEFWDRYWERKAVKTPWFKSTKIDYLNFRDYSYLDKLTEHNLKYLDSLMNKMINNARDGEFKKRAEFIYLGWKSVKSIAFGDDFLFRVGRIPDGYKKIFSEDFEGDNNAIPVGWKVWDRANTGTEINYKGLSSSKSYSGNSSFRISITPDEAQEGFVTVYTAFSVRQGNKYCVRLKANSTDSYSYGISLAFKKEEGEFINKRLSPGVIENDWSTEVSCIAIPNSIKHTEIRLMLDIKSKQNHQINVWFDDVEVFYTTVE